MIHDSNLQALRAGLPWVFLGFLGLAASMGLWLLASNLEQGTFVVLYHATGAVGSGLFLIGLLQLARGRVARRLSGLLVFAFAAWLVEFTLRISSLLWSEFEPTAWRWLAASFACTALSRGLPWLWDRNVPEGQHATWRRTGRLFAIQICAALSLVIASRSSELTALEVYWRVTDAIPLGLALAWLIFAGPYVHLLMSIRRTAKCVDSRASVTEILHG